MRLPPAGITVSARPKLTLKPGQACAIPLLNVLKGKKTPDPMFILPAPPPPASSKDFVDLPAPSCDDVK